MNNLRFLCCVLLSLAFAHHARAQSGWSCNANDFEYDMTLYLTIGKDGSTISDLANYEVAAFVEDECRGVATLEVLSDTEQYLYLRVRSNVASGENVSFRIFNKQAGKEVEISAEPFVFQSNAILGLPSSPITITLVKDAYQQGDVNGDGRVNVTDIRLIINKIFNRSLPANFIESACDMNGDGRINVTDIRLIINKIFNR